MSFKDITPEDSDTYSSDSLEEARDAEDEEFYQSFIQRIKDNNFFCAKCNLLPLISIPKKDKDNNLIDCKCQQCSFEWKVHLYSFFVLDWIEPKTMQDYEDSYTDLQDISTLNDLEKERLAITSKCLGIWKYLIKSKEIFEIFVDNINNMASTCSIHKGCVYNEYCTQCKQNLCSRCVSECNDHNGHNKVIFSEVVNENKISEKLIILNDLRRMKLDNNTTIYKNTDNILYKKIHLLQLKPQTEEVRNNIAMLEKKRRELAKSYSTSCIRNDCWELLFKLNLALYENSRYENKLNYIYVKNVESTWNFSVKNEPQKQPEINENEDIQIILQYYDSIISSLTTKPFLLKEEDHNMRRSFSKLANHIFVNITSINYKDEKYFSTKRNKIKLITLLQNGTFAVCCYGRNIVKSFSVEDLSVQMKYSTHKSEINYMCCVGNDYFFLCGTDGKIIRYKTHRSIVLVHLSKLLAEMFQFDAHKGSIIKILNDNDLFLYSLGGEDRCLKKWKGIQTKHFECVKTFTFDTQLNKVCNFVTMERLEDGRIVTVSTDNVLRYWNNEGEITSNRLCNIDCMWVSGIAVLSRKFLLIGGKNFLFLIDTEINTVINKFKYGGITSFVWLSPNSFLCVDKKVIYEFGVDINKLQLVIQKEHTHGGIYAAIGMIDFDSVVTVGEDSRIIKWNYSIDNDHSGLLVSTSIT